MTCITYDGQGTLAGDNQMTSWGVPVKYKKVQKARGHLTGVMGDASVSVDILQWFKDGAIKDDYPKTASGALEDSEGYLIVVNTEGVLMCYSRSPNPLVYGKIPFAFGSGMDLAIGAMAAGKSARDATKIAIANNVGCGLGVSSISLARK